MKTYIGQEEKQRKPGTTVAGILVSIFLFVYGFLVMSPYALATGFLLLMGSLFRRTLCVSEEGFTTTYQLLFFKYRELLSFDVIDTIHVGKPRDRDATLLYFAKGLSIRGIVFQELDGQEILQWVEIHYPSIKIASITK